MTLDKDTLTQAEEARNRLLELQHSAEVARVDYHHTIRRLHAAGGSLREIAEALGLSHQRVHQIVEPVDGSAGPTRGGPHHGLHRRLRTFAPWERFTSEARDVVAGAIGEAGALGHRRVGSEHLLISILTSPNTRAGSALTRLGVTRDAVVAAVTERLGSGPDTGGRRRPFTPAARRVLERALLEAKSARDKEIRADHILLGLVGDDGDAASILSGLGASGDQIRAALAGIEEA